MDGLASQGYYAMGYSLRYEYGIFRQKLVDGWQTELPDFWLPGGRVWMQEVPEKSVEVHFNGHIEESWNNQYHIVKHKDYTNCLLYTSSQAKAFSPTYCRVWLNQENP